VALLLLHVPYPRSGLRPLFSDRLERSPSSSQVLKTNLESSVTRRTTGVRRVGIRRTRRSQAAKLKKLTIRRSDASSLADRRSEIMQTAKLYGLDASKPVDVQIKLVASPSDIISQVDDLRSCSALALTVLVHSRWLVEALETQVTLGNAQAEVDFLTLLWLPEKSQQAASNADRRLAKCDTPDSASRLSHRAVAWQIPRAAGSQHRFQRGRSQRLVRTR
jgi:hypothetical protein